MECVDPWAVAGWALTGAMLGASRPAGPLFGRMTYRNMDRSLFNTGHFRIGWSWNADGWASPRNYSGIHGASLERQAIGIAYIFLAQKEGGGDGPQH